jgi:alkanesulfonate monooxygenase SsuD/methylene tetrahydromethanopterin reductase-like flavin-dependent oxidoreductase (luciferase family)
LKARKNENENENENIRFGCYIYQDGLKYKDILNIALECEKLGYDSLWLKDNFIPWISDYHISFDSKNDNNTTSTTKAIPQEKSNEKRTMLECWTTLSSLASATTKIRLGAILVNLYRNPSIVAKMASSLDVISNGRLEIGVSAGWFEKEAHAYGFAFPPNSVRVQMLEESILILRRMLANSESQNNNINDDYYTASFKGKYFNISDAECNPKPIQEPHIPIWIGGSGRKTLALVAKYADGWNYGLCSYTRYIDKLSILKNYCNKSNKSDNNRTYNAKKGGDNHNIMKAWHGILFLRRNERELKKETILDKTIWKDSELVIAGTPDTILREINKYVHIGVTYFTIYFPDLPNMTSLQLFAKNIIPYFRNR